MLSLKSRVSYWPETHWEGQVIWLDREPRDEPVPTCPGLRFQVYHSTSQFLCLFQELSSDSCVWSKHFVCWIISSALLHFYLNWNLYDLPDGLQSSVSISELLCTNSGLKVCTYSASDHLLSSNTEEAPRVLAHPEITFSQTPLWAGHIPGSPCFSRCSKGNRRQLLFQMESSNNNEINLSKSSTKSRPGSGGMFSKQKWKGKMGREMRTHPRITPNLLLSPFQVWNENWELYSGVASERQASRSGYLLVDRVGRVCCQGGSLWHFTGQSFECTPKLCSPGELRKVAKSLTTSWRLWKLTVRTLGGKIRHHWGERSLAGPWPCGSGQGMNRPKKEENTHLNVCST